jgi:hypothetical protein
MYISISYTYFMDFEGRFHLMITLIFNVLTNDLGKRRESLEPDMSMLYASIGDNESSDKAPYHWCDAG